MLSQFGIERAAQYIIAFAIILALVLLFAWVLRRLTGGRLLLPGQDRGRSRQPRLGIVDIYDLDRQRQLILLRRDNVEHLLLVGGPNDVVVETNIVRVAGARLPAGPAGANEHMIERPEPILEQSPRPQVESAGRPSIEVQLAAQLDTFVKRPSEGSDIDQELAPIASVSAPVPQPPMPPQPEPLLKPTRVEPAAPATFPNLKPVPPAPRPEPRPEMRPEPRPEPRLGSATPPPPLRPVPPAPPASPVPAPAPMAQAEPVRPAADNATPDAAILSDMAKQLEEALKRPVPGPSTDPSDEPEADEMEPPAPAARPPFRPQGLPTPANEPRKPDQVRVPPAPAVQPAPAEPVKPVPVPPSPAPSSTNDQNDPFSVEAIEAEFARLLGRPGEKH